MRHVGCAQASAQTRKEPAGGCGRPRFGVFPVSVKELIAVPDGAKGSLQPLGVPSAQEATVWLLVRGNRDQVGLPRPPELAVPTPSPGSASRVSNRKQVRGAEG